MASPLEIAAIGWAVSPFFRFMVNRLLAKLMKQSKHTQGMEADLKKLQQILPEIQSVLSVAETRKVANSHQAVLLRQMKEAVYDAEDVMDEFHYRLLEAEAATCSDQVAATAQTAVKRFFGMDPLKTSLDKAIKGLEQVRQTSETFMNVTNFEKITTDAGSSCGKLQTTPYREMNCFRYSPVLGRENEQNMIIGEMIKQANTSYPPLVFSVVGAGGIGKTSLAQLIYNHEKIVRAFRMKIWVRVGSVINEEVTKKILAQASSREIQDPELYTLELKRSMSQKFLLVLDDVWVDEEKYDQQERTKLWMTWIFGPLQKCNTGSSILMTTRLKSVVEMVHSDINIDLRELSWEHSCSLFKSHVFPLGIGSVTNMKELWKIGEQIVRKLKGSPLALKVVGGQLSNNFSVNEWTRVLENSLSPKVTDILRLSYDSLPPHLKPCFAYCSLFPKGYYFSEGQVEQLIHMWIAQGFVYNGSGTGLSLEDIGRCYFDDLCSRSFFQPIKKGYGSFYVMHDLIIDLAQSVSKEECCQILNDRSYIPSTLLRHVSVSGTHLSALSKIPRLDKLRTLLVLNLSEKHVCIPMSDDMLTSLTGARVLDLSGCCIEQFPETVEQMIHLRYLAFDRTSAFLPETCSRLFNLQVVSMVGHRKNLVTHSRLFNLQVRNITGHRSGPWCICRKGLDNCAPQNMSSLSNLRHVYVLNKNPIEITGHCKIPEFHGDAVFTVNHGNKLEDIQDIGFQGSLVIRELQNVASKHDALKAQIGRNEHMKKLKLEWCLSTGASGNNDNEVLEVLQPPSNLSSLSILGYRGSKSTFWLENDYLTNLSSLCLSNCSELRELPPFGHLPKLEQLTIHRLNAVKRITPEFYGTKGALGFPYLKMLVLEDMQNWVEWSMPECYRPLFPLLEHVKIRKCSKLRKIPNIFPKKRVHRYSVDHRQFELGIVSCESKHGSKFYDELLKQSSYTHSLVQNLLHPSVICWKVTDSSGWKYIFCQFEYLFGAQTCKFEFLDFHIYPEAVKDLHLYNCKGPMPKYGFKKLSSLEGLFINNCMISLISRGYRKENDNKDLLPESLKSLTIKQSSASSNFLSRCFQSLSSLVMLEIGELEMELIKEIDLQALTSLAKLQIKNCKHLWDIKGLEALTCLTTMKIVGCPHLFLTFLTSCSCSHISSPHATCLVPSLKHLKWDICQDFKYANPEGDYEQRDIWHNSVETLEISCSKLITKSLSGFLRPFSSLSTLKINSFLCHQHEILDPQYWRGLKVLHISGCLSPLELINYNVLTMLEELIISKCPYFIIQPAQLSYLYSLRNLKLKLPNSKFVNRP